MASTHEATGGETTPRLNLLHLEKSPYLLQHAENPVNWYGWNSDAFTKAKVENKLIFLSIGYSTCHWCHVMERESFECQKTADILNKHYVSIKVDREERPDVDKIYMSYVQRTTGSGGWPLSIFLTPDLQPVFGGTYFPPDDDQGHVGFKSLLTLIAQQWAAEHRSLQQDAKQAVEDLKKTLKIKFARSEPIPDERAWLKCFQQIMRSYDKDHGGFSEAPKFPQPSMFNFLFHIYGSKKLKTEGEQALDMCLNTLKKMAYGGIHDHVNYGFARYSVDRKWHVPHFEKMLYDQAQLAVSYVDAYIATKDNFYSEIVDDILTYVGRDLSHKLGGFYGAEDADSLPTERAEGKKEGAFCVWEYDDIKSLLTDRTEKASDFDIYTYHFKILPDGNVPKQLDRHNELVKKNVLACFESYEHTAEHFKMDVVDIKYVLAKCNKILYLKRQERPKPQVDTKILTGWNGLMLGAFAKAGFAMNKPEYTARAVSAATFIKKYLVGEGGLMRCVYGDGEGIIQTAHPIEGFLDDYAYLIRGLLSLYEATLDSSWLVWAEQLQDRQNEKFWDNENFGYYNSTSEDPSIIIRDKELQDGAEPCGNSVAVHNLLYLSAYLARKDLHEMAKKTLAAYSHRLQEIPLSLPEMTSALMLYRTEVTQVFIVGKSKDQSTQDLLDVVRTRMLPGRILALADGPEGPSKLLYTRNESFAKLKRLDNQSAAYVCKNFTCMLPVTSPSDLAASLDREDEPTTSVSRTNMT